MGNQLQKVAVTAYDRVGPPRRSERRIHVVICITADATRCSGILEPDRKFHQFGQKQVPGLCLAVAIELRSTNTRPSSAKVASDISISMSLARTASTSCLAVSVGEISAAIHTSLSMTSLSAFIREQLAQHCFVHALGSGMFSRALQGVSQPFA
jgi:hypothetical protein